MNWGCDKKLRDSAWDVSNSSFEKDRAYGFSWPQRNYRCSFCKKEFKSAQALGGHMNVHRRDRARMRLSPSSWDSTSPNNTNTNPNFFSPWSPLSPAKFSPYNGVPNYSLLSDPVIAHSPYIGEGRIEAKEYLQQRDMVHTMKKNKGATLDQLTGFGKIKEDAKICNANECVRLDLNMGLIQDSREDLDLELRLGYS